MLEEVVVTGRRGAALVRPETELDGAQIDDLGAYDIGEAVARLGERLGLNDPPLLIINGRRVVNPGDFLNFPPDALSRLEVLPPQASALYGGAPTQRVVNLVLQPRFQSRDGQAAGARPTAGGRTTLTLDARQSTIAETDISQYGVRLSRDTALRGAERPDYLHDNPGREAVTLRPASEAAAANMSLRREIAGWSAALSGQAQVRTDRSAARLADGVIETRNRAQNLSLNGGLSGDVAGWAVRLGLNGSASRLRREGLASGTSRNMSLAADVGANRTLMDLPAGPLVINLSGRRAWFDSTFNGATGETSRSSDATEFGGTASIPLSRSSAESGLKLLGDATMNLGATWREADGVGGETLSAGLTLSPARKLRFSAQWSTATDAPSGQAKLAPIVYGEPRIVFDFATGEAVEVLPLLGGNPDLRPQTSDQLGVTVSAGPFTSWQVQGGVNFQRATSRDGVGALPALTPEVEAAFPERFQRDADGRLIVIDQRPINLASTRMETLSTNVAFNAPLPADGDGGRRALRIGLTHNWQLANRLVLAPGLPELDRLAGDGGGVPRHQLSLTADSRFGSWGLNASANWRGPARIRRVSGQDGPDDLRLEALLMVDIKLGYTMQTAAPSADGESPARRVPGTRLELQVDNLFDARPGASLGDGRPAPGYGRDNQDPLGRTVRLTLSRRF